MTLWVPASKSLAPTKILHSLCYLFGFSFKLRSYSVSHFHRNSELGKDSYNGGNGSVYSRGLYQNMILKAMRGNPKAFRDDHWVVPDYCSALVVDSNLLLSVINSIRLRPAMVLMIFRWAERQKGFHHSEFVFCSVLEVLLENNLMSPAYWVTERVIDVSMEGVVVDALIDGYLNQAVSLRILDFILWVCTKRSDVERCLWLFDKMVRNGFSPDVNNCNRILKVFRDRGLDGKVREVYESMVEFGIEPTIVTYNTMLDVFCRGEDVQQVLELLQEMESLGCSPNEATYNVLVAGLSKKGEVEKAKELAAEMSIKGLNLSVYSYNSLISGCSHKGMMGEAVILEEEMQMRGTLPNVSTYNALMYVYCKEGRIGCAMLWIAVMVKKNVEMDLISYNTLMYGYSEVGDVCEALLLLSEVRKKGSQCNCSHI